MAYLLVKHTVKDFEVWKPHFDEHAPTRRAAGSKGGRILRSADSPNEVVVFLEWDSVENARAFVASDDLREVMQRAGVTGAPEIHFLDEAAQSNV